jgi:hypothetical protein
MLMQTIKNSSDMFVFGKHQGKYFHTIFAIDYPYLQWCRARNIISIDRDILIRVDRFIENVHHTRYYQNSPLHKDWKVVDTFLDKQKLLSLMENKK